MASVQYLFSHSYELRNEIHEKKFIFDWLSKFRNECAILIQTIWRRYMCRQKYLRTRRNIITIQSFYHGWVVRRCKQQYIEQHAADMKKLRMKMAAIRIQATYRGYLVKKYMSRRGGTPAQRIRKQKQMNEAAKDMQEYIREQYAENAKIQRDTDEDDAKKKVMFCLFKWHHLLRTRMREGVFSCHSSERLSLFEEIMKMFPYKDYMDTVHRSYENAVKSQSTHRYFLPSNSEMRKCEDLLRKRYKYDDVRPEPVQDYFDVGFNLDTRVSHSYEKTMFGREKYTSDRLEIVTHNDEIKAKNVSPDPFILGNFNLDLNDRTMAYFIDYFEKHKCTIHNPPEIEDD